MKKKIIWTATILILCVVGLLKEFRPSGPFLVDYAVDFENFTTDEMTHDILPSTSLAYTGSIAFLLFVTDILAYKPIIILGEICTVLTWSMTIWYFDTVTKAMWRQVAYGISVVTTELAYFTYMYANVDKKDYMKVTSYVHSAIHTGQFISGLTGQLLLSFEILELDKMNYLSLLCGTSGLFMTFFLPRVLTDVVVKVESSTQETSDKDKATEIETEHHHAVIHYAREGFHPKVIVFKTKSAYTVVKKNFIYAYTNVGVVWWSIWWTLSYAMYIQVNLYVESLWKDIEEEGEQTIYNGAVHCSHALISAILALAIGTVNIKWVKYGGFIFGTGSVIQGVSLYFLSQTDDLYVAYGCFVVFQTTYQVLIIISKSEVAEELRENSAAFIFGINSLGACLIQLILTVIIVGEYGFKLSIRDHFIVCASYSWVLGGCYLIYAIPFWKRGSWTLQKLFGEEEPPIESVELGILP